MRYGDYWFAIISHNRPNNYARMRKIMGFEATWYISKDTREKWAYEAAGAKHVINAGKLCEARNMALDDAHEKELTCVELSDDLMRMYRLRRKSEDRFYTERITFEQAWRYVSDVIENEQQFKLFGIAPFDSRLSGASYWDKPIQHHVVCIGDFIAVKPCSIRFDNDAALKEDYDYTLQHLQTYGGVTRMNHIMPTFLHRDNAGGAVDWRNTQREQAVIAHLKQKWGSWIKDNPRRENEILLNTSPQDVKRK